MSVEVVTVESETTVSGRVPSTPLAANTLLTDTNTIEIISEGYRDKIIVNLDRLESVPKNRGTVSRPLTVFVKNDILLTKFSLIMVKNVTKIDWDEI